MRVKNYCFKQIQTKVGVLVKVYPDIGLRSVYLEQIIVEKSALKYKYLHFCKLSDR